MREALKKHRRLLIWTAALLLLSLLCLFGYLRLSRLLDSQRAAERWKGDSDMDFAQVSAFMPGGTPLTLEQLYAFRTAMVAKFHEAALDVDNKNQLFSDAWSGFGKVKAAGSAGKGEVGVTAVGGDYFMFHPLRLLSGGYLTAEDLMKDRVLLDRETAWLLFGGTELTGLSLTIEGVPFVVAGVIEREDDAFSRRAYGSGMGIYMSYEAYALLNENAGISCYEVVMPQPVKGFAYTVATGKFPIGQGQLVDNSARYGFFTLLKAVKSWGSRSMQSSAVAYPYWENAARSTEDACSALLVLMLLSAAMPTVLAATVALRYGKRGKAKLEEDLLPRLKERTQESLRVRQRRHWEKTHPDENK